MHATILVVDDNPMVRQVVQSMLLAAGYPVLVAEDGPAALALYAASPADAAIVDVDMPGMDGVEVCRTLREQAEGAKRPLVTWLMTGVVRAEIIEQGKLAGALGVLAKPFTRDELLHCFDRFSVHSHAVA